MSNYPILIALAYLNQYKSNYILSDLQEILGMTAEQFDGIISSLFEYGYIKYENFLITVTQKGIYRLVRDNMQKYDATENELNLLHIKKTTAIPLEHPYAPENFLGKILRRN